MNLGVGRFFNGKDWVGPIELNIEHEPLCDGDIGPKTGEMGTLAWYSDDERQPLFQKVLAPLKPILQANDFRGDVDINCIVNEKRVVPLEITARLGSPTVHVQQALHRTPWCEFLGAIADGRQISLEYRREYGVGVAVVVPPYPYTGRLDGHHTAKGFPVQFVSEPSQEERLRHYHFESVRREVNSNDCERLLITNGIAYAAIVTGTGETVAAARESVYSAVRNLCIPKAIYRTDIGKKFIETDADKLRAWGWI